MAKVIPKDQLLAMEDTDLGTSSWFQIDQERIDRFAQATEDHQFIHVDQERAAATPFGGTIAHGFLTLSLLPKLAEETTVVPEALVLGINYGLNKVRFLQPVRSGSRVRLRSKILRVEEKGYDERTGGRLLVTGESTVEIEGEERPALIAETLVMYVVGPSADG